MIPSRFFFFLFVSLALLSTNSRAAAPDVTGLWKWDFERNGEKREISMKLKQDGSKAGGVITGPDGATVEIRDGKVTDDGKLTFYIELERDGNTMKINFDGKASGDTIAGKTRYINREGEQRELDWVAKREPKKRDLSGEYRSSFKRQDGTPMESTLRLKQKGESLEGSQVSANGNETQIREGRVQGAEVSFKIVRERDGRSVTAHYRGKIQDDGSIKGTMESDWTGEVRRLDWEAKKAQ